MHEPVQMLGETTKIDSRPGRPTIISARLPGPRRPSSCRLRGSGAALIVPRTATITNQTRGTVVCETAVIADNPWLRFRGLLGRDSLPAGEGILLTPSPSIHSAFMKFEFDAVFLDRNMKVVRLVERMPRWKARGAKGARSVLELAAGEIQRRGVQVGDELAVTGGKEPPPGTGDTY